MALFEGRITSKIIDLRFSASGKLVRLNKKCGDKIVKGELVASLDRKISQATLDKELADYERTRADFEIFNQKNPNPQEAIDKYLKTEKQAELNASVKNVEIAKNALDQCDIFSPVNGVILDDSNLVTGMNITPASGSIKIIDNDSFRFEFEIEADKIKDFINPVKAKISLEAISQVIEVDTNPVYGDGKKYIVSANLPYSDLLLLNISGKIEV